MEGPSTSRIARIPMTYRLRDDSKQFVVVAAGGFGKNGMTKMGDSVVAFALPD